MSFVNTFVLSNADNYIDLSPMKWISHQPNTYTHMYVWVVVRLHYYAR